MIRLLAAVKNFNQAYLENALIKRVENRYNWRQLLHELQALQIHCSFKNELLDFLKIKDK